MLHLSHLNFIANEKEQTHAVQYTMPHITHLSMAIEQKKKFRVKNRSDRNEYEYHCMEMNGNEEKTKRRIEVKQTKIPLTNKIKSPKEKVCHFLNVIQCN